MIYLCDGCSNLVCAALQKSKHSRRACCEDYVKQGTVEQIQKLPIHKIHTMKKLDISNELSRTYTYMLFPEGCREKLELVAVEIPHPQVLYIGHASHRVWNGGTVELCHAPGPIRDADHNIIGMCFLRFEPKDCSAPVSF